MWHLLSRWTSSSYAWTSLLRRDSLGGKKTGCRNGLGRPRYLFRVEECDVFWNDDVDDDNDDDDDDADDDEGDDDDGCFVVFRFFFTELLSH